LPPVDEVYFAVGTTIKVAGSQSAFRAVDFDASLAVARAALAASEMLAGIDFYGALDFEQELVAWVTATTAKTLVSQIVRIWSSDTYTRTRRQKAGIGSALLAHLPSLTDRPLLIGTWKAASWAIRFYERRGFTLINDPTRETLLRRYWTISDSQIEHSVSWGMSASSRTTWLRLKKIEPSRAKPMRPWRDIVDPACD
jgi:GNAT superfamily N-acetyltransferase